MKRILLIVALLLSVIFANAQSAIFKAMIEEIKPVVDQKSKVWRDGNTMYGSTPEREAQYVFYCNEVCKLADKYIDKLTDVNEKISLLWVKEEHIEDIFDSYETEKRSLSPDYRAYSLSAERTIKTILSIAKDIKDPEEKDVEILLAGEALAKFYFKRAKFEEAKEYYKLSLGAYGRLALIRSEDEIKETGQRLNYWMGYAVYKLGLTQVAAYYYGKAKAILHDDLIVAYK